MSQMNGYDLTAIEPDAQVRANAGVGYLFNQPEAAAALAEASGAKWVVAGMLQKSSYLFAYVTVRVSNVTTKQLIGEFNTRLEGPMTNDRITRRGMQRIAAQVDAAIGVGSRSGVRGHGVRGHEFGVRVKIPALPRASFSPPRSRWSWSTAGYARTSPTWPSPACKGLLYGGLITPETAAEMHQWDHMGVAPFCVTPRPRQPSRTRPGPAPTPLPAPHADHPIPDRPVRRNSTGCKTALNVLSFTR
jgi:Protein of unknown function (DUF2380)